MSPTARPSLHGVLSPQLLGVILRDHERYVRREAGGQRAVFKFVQLAGMDLSTRVLDDADFTAASMSRTRLIRASLQRAAFFRADLTQADLRGADARRADFRGALLGGANLAFANLDEADMRRATLAVVDNRGNYKQWGQPGPDGTAGASLRGSAMNGARLDDAQAGGTDFSNCSLKGAKLNGANLKGAVFAGAILSGAQFRGATMAEVDLTGAVLTGVDLAELRLPASALANCICDPGAEAMARRVVLAERLSQAAAWVSSNGKQGSPANLDGEDIRVLGPAFRGRSLPAFSARRCLGIGVDFTKAELPGAVFEGADLRDANFSGADLRGVSFRDANLAFARFDGAILGPLELARGTRLEPNLDGANLTGVRLDLAVAPGAQDLVA